MRYVTQARRFAWRWSDYMGEIVLARNAEPLSRINSLACAPLVPRVTFFEWN